MSAYRRQICSEAQAEVLAGFFLEISLHVLFNEITVIRFNNTHAIMEPTTGIEPVTSSLPRKCSTTELCGPLEPGRPKKLERVMGIEPTLSAWKAEVLPLNYTRIFRILNNYLEGEGFDPSKA